MDIRYIDAHCHLQFEQYDADREQIIDQMREQGIAAVVVGCDLESSKAAVELAEQYEHLYASVGIHPNESNVGHAMSNIAEIRELAKSQKVVAIGECGLDYFRPEDLNEETKQRQKEIFKMQIVLAAELDKPLIIHARPSKGTQRPAGCPDAGDAYRDIIEILKEAKITYPHLRGDAHFFAGGVDEAEAFVALGFTLSFTAVITFARDYDAAIRAAPLTSILAETDAPYVAPASRRGQRNDPLSVVEVAAKIAEIRSEDPEKVRAALVSNTSLVFGLSSC